MYRNLKDGRLIGTAGERRVETELILRGFVPCIPAIDVGVDIVLLNGVKIQIKTASLCQHKQYEYGVYRFDLTNHVGHSQAKVSRLRDWSKVCDFLLLWCIDEDRFFVVPATTDKCSVWIASRGEKLHTPDPEVAKRLREHGMDFATIARQMGVCHKTAKCLSLGTRRARKDEFSQQVLQFEDRWDLLDVNATVERALTISTDGPVTGSNGITVLQEKK